MPTPVTITEITPGSTGWQTVDLTTYFGSDAGNVAGVILEFENNNSGSSYANGARKYGSTDTHTLVQTNNSHSFVWCGVDSSDRIEINVGSTSLINVYLHAYYLNSEAVFLTNWTDKSISATATWTDIDISSDSGSDTATAAIFLMKNTSTTGRYYGGFRDNGSSVTTAAYGTLNRTATPYGVYIVIGLTSEVCEHIIENAAIDCYLVGYLKSGFTKDDYTDKSTATTGSYQDVDVSSGAPSGATSAYFFIDSTSPLQSYSWAIREKGSSRDIYLSGVFIGGTAWTKIDANKLAEQKIINNAMDLYLTGWGETAAASTWTPKVIFID